MGTYVAYDPWGKSYTFKIKGDTPSPTEMDRARSHMGLPPLAPSEGDGLLSDLSTAVKSGVGGLQAGAGWLTGIDSWEQAGKARQDEAAREMSPASTQAQAKGIFGGGGLRALALGAAETAPQIVPSLAAAAVSPFIAPEGAMAAAGGAILRFLPRIATGAIERYAAAEGVTAAAKAGELVAGALGGAGIEGLLSAGMNGQQAKEAVLTLAREAPNEFKNSEVGSRMLAKWGGDYGKAAEAAANEIANGIALKTGAVAAITSLPGAAIEAALLRNIGKGTASSMLGGAIRGAGLSAAQEGGEEAIQSGYEQAVTSQDIAKAGGPQGTWGDVAKAALEGGTLGAVVGGGVGGLAGGGASLGRNEATVNKDLENYLASQALPPNPPPQAQLQLSPDDQAAAMPFRVVASTDGMASDGSPIGLKWNIVGTNTGQIYGTFPNRNAAVEAASQHIASLSSPQDYARTRGFEKAQGVALTPEQGGIAIPPAIKPDISSSAELVHNPARMAPPLKPAYSGVEDRYRNFVNNQRPALSTPIEGTSGTATASQQAPMPVKEVLQTQGQPVGWTTGEATGRLTAPLKMAANPLTNVKGMAPMPLTEIGDQVAIDGALPLEALKTQLTPVQAPLSGTQTTQVNPDIQLVRPPTQRYVAKDRNGKNLGLFLTEQEAKSWMPDGGSVKSEIVAPPTKQEATVAQDSLKALLQKRLSGYGLDDISLNLQDSLGKNSDGQDILGMYRDKVISIATGAYSPKLNNQQLADVLSGVVDHEATHALKERGFFSPSEWKLLSQFVQKKKFIDEKGKEKSFTWWDHAVGVNPNLSDDNVIEEAVANAFKAWTKHKNVAPGTVGGVFSRLVQFFKTLGGAINDSGVRNIFAKIEAGDTKVPSAPSAPPVAPPPSVPKFMVNPTGTVGARIPPAERGYFDSYRDSLYYGAAYDSIAKAVAVPSRLLGIGKIFGLQGKELDSAISQWLDQSVWKPFQSGKLPVGRFLDSLKEAGGFITPGMNPYLLKDLTPTATSTEIKRAWERIFDPAIKATRAIPFSEADMTSLASVNPEAQHFMEMHPIGSQGAMALYLYSRHAPERNAEMERRSKGTLVAGSGLTTDAANQIQSWFSNHPTFNQVQAAADLWYEGIKDMRRVQIQYGTTPDYEAEEADQPRYQWYVPLRGFLEDAGREEDEVAYMGRGSSIYGRESPSATGRSTQAGKILESIMAMHTAAVVRGHRNREGQAFAKLIRENKDIEIGGVKLSSVIRELDRAPQKFVYDDNTGYIRQVVDPRYKNRDDIFIAKEGGVEQIFEGPKEIMMAMRGTSGMPAGNIEKAIKALSVYTRYIGRLATSLNPEFLLSNIPRDLINAHLNSYGIKGIDNSVILKEFAPALKDIWNTLRTGEARGKYGDLYRKLQELGGTTESLGLRTTDDITRELRNELMGGPSKMKSAVKKLGEFIENNNTAAENASRVVVFDMVRQARNAEIDSLIAKGAIDQNQAQDMRDNADLEAAGAAKNLTVNFDEGGTARTAVNALYLFFNASIQGTFGILGALGRSGKARKIVGGILAGGVIMDLMNSALSGEDDQGRSYYDSIPDYILERNLVVMIPGTSTMIKIPMPYGYNAIWNTGRSISKVMRGKQTPLDGVGSAAWTLAESLNPLGGSQSFFNFLAPTVFDPFVDLANNKDYSDRPIYPEASGFGAEKPMHMQYWNDTNPLWVWAANQLAVGSTDNISSPVPWLEISPNQLEYAFDYLLGGAGVFVTRTLGTGYNVLAGNDPTKEISWNDIPLARKLVSATTSRNDLGQYMDYRKNLLQIDKELKTAREAGDFNSVRQARSTYARQLAVMEQFKNLDKRRSSISKKIRELQSSRTMDEGQKYQAIKSLKLQADRIVGQANKIAESAGL